jgi:uncharacterized protein (TIGR03067 family)
MRTILIAVVFAMGCGRDAEVEKARQAEAKSLQALADAAAKRKAESEAKTEAIKNDPKNLEGKWELTSANSDGRDWAKGRIPDSYYMFKNGYVTHTVGGQEVRTAPFKLDPSKTPGHIDMPGDNNPKLPKFQEGLYKLDGDALTLCTASNFKRPTELKTGQGLTLLKLKRAK